MTSAELERESSQLRKQLSDLDSIRRKSAGDVDAERHRREEIEQKLQDAQEQLFIMVLGFVFSAIWFRPSCLLRLRNSSSESFWKVKHPARRVKRRRAN